MFVALMTDAGVDAPLFELLWFYVLIAVVFGCFLGYAVWNSWVTFHWLKSLKISAASLTETQANFLIITSFNYTSLVSISVLTQSSVIMVAILSYVINGRRYTLVQYLGLTTCLVGIGLLIVADLMSADWQFGGTVEGDTMALAGTFLFSL